MQLIKFFDSVLIKKNASRIFKVNPVFFYIEFSLFIVPLDYLPIKSPLATISTRKIIFLLCEELVRCFTKFS